MPPRGPQKKEGSKNDFTAQIVFLLLGLFLASVILSQLANAISYWTAGLADAAWLQALRAFFRWMWPLAQVGAIVTCIASIWTLAHYNNKLKALNIAEKQIYKVYDPKADEATPGVAEEQVKNKKWDEIMRLINSTNPSDWRQAILEADIMLDELLRGLGYIGDSVGDMLKGVDKSDMRSLESAWEAHKIRNSIAHSGTDFPLSEREAKRVVSLFEHVFKEFELI